MTRSCCIRVAISKYAPPATTPAECQLDTRSPPRLPFTVVKRGLTALTLVILLAACHRNTTGPRLVVAVNAGVEGDALKEAARDYERLAGIRMDIVELPYANLFEKAMLDLDSRTGAYDVIMMDDPWFPRLASDEKLAALEPFYRNAGLPGPEPDFVATSLALCHEPYPSGRLYALPYVGNSQLFF